MRFLIYKVCLVFHKFLMKILKYSKVFNEDFKVHQIM